jgi:hypothetical protein
MTKPTISDELLKKAGYVELDAEKMAGADRLFQKKFTNSHGTKYFIEVKYWYFSQSGAQSRFWDFTMQLETEKGPVTFHTVQWFNQDGICSGRTIEEAEAYFEWLWIQHGKPYYEEFAR